MVIYECFDEATERVSAYSVYFDIATKKILLIDYAVKHDNNSFNRLTDWNNPAFGVVKLLAEKRLERIKK